MSNFSTAISDVRVSDAPTIRGYPHKDMIGKLPFSDAAFLTIVGRLPVGNESALVNAMFTSILDYGFIASTISAARYIASGNPQLIPAVGGGLLAAGKNTLSPQDSFDLIEHVLSRSEKEERSPKDVVEVVVSEYLADRRRLPGFGHPTQKHADFRSTALFELARQLGFFGQACETYEALDQELRRQSGRTLPVNIDACLACLGHDLGLTAHEVVGIAVISIMPGLVAHVIEEIAANQPLRYIRDGAYDGESLRPLPASENRVADAIEEIASEPV